MPKVYKEFTAIGGFAAAAPVKENPDKPKEKLTAKTVCMNILNYMAGSLTPLIPILIGAAMFKTMLSILGPDMLGLFTAESDIYKLFDFVYDAGFYFLPIFIGYTAAAKIGASPILGMFMGGTTANLVNGVIGCLIALAASTVLTYLFGFDKNDPAVKG